MGSRAEMGWISRGWAVRWQEMQREQNKIKSDTYIQHRVPHKASLASPSRSWVGGLRGAVPWLPCPLPLGCLLKPRVINSKRLPGCGGAGLHCFRIFALSFSPSGSLDLGTHSAPSGRPGEEQVHYFHLLTVLPDLPLLPPNNNGKMCFLEILKREKERE